MLARDWLRVTQGPREAAGHELWICTDQGGGGMLGLLGGPSMLTNSASQWETAGPVRPSLLGNWSHFYRRRDPPSSAAWEPGPGFLAKATVGESDAFAPHDECF